jgi:S1-C subfamily serine protease
LKGISQGIYSTNRRQILSFLSVPAFAFFIGLWHQAWAESWTDSTGQHTVTADFLGLEGDVVALRSANGKRITVPLAKLNPDSRALAEKLGAKSAGPAVDGIVALVADADELEKVALRQRSAEKALRMYQSFLSKPGLDPEERAKAEKRLNNWEDRASKKLVRWGTRWETIAQIQQHTKDEERLLSEAHRLMEINNDEMAREKFEEASAVNIEEVRADFYLGILHLLVGYHSRSAVEHFDECVKRLEMSEDRLDGARRSNLIAALNNRAICHARNRDHAKALKDWEQAIQLAPLTPELAQNLGYYSQLVSLVSDWRVSKAVTKKVTDQYAAIAVANESAGFQDNVGWLVIPYVDAPSLPDFESIDLLNSEEPTLERLLVSGEQAENDYRVVGWATALAVDSDYLLTSRRVIQGAPGVWVRRDGVFLKDTPGKVVAISGSHDLALVRVNGLEAEPLPLETTESTRAMDIRLASYAEPGILQDGLQVTKGTIVDLEQVYIPLGMQYLMRDVAVTKVAGDGAQSVSDTTRSLTAIAVPIGVDYVTGVIHDAQINRGSVGCPLINLQGKVMGIDAGRRSMEDPNNRSAVNHTEIRSFLDSTGLEFAKLSHPSATPFNDIDQYVKTAADRSVFQIAIVGRVPRLSWTSRIGESVHGITKLTDWNAFEDDNCIRCNGKGDVACPARRCVEGRIGHKVTEKVGEFPGTGKPIMQTHWEYEDCRNCSGRGYVKCIHCGGKGVEPSIR